MTTCYDIQIANKEKDMLISQLKAHIFELEQYEKDYDLLSQKYCQLQNEFATLKDAKNRLEYDLKQREDAYNCKLCNLRGENENLQIGYNEKMNLNKKLFSENDCLGKQLDMKNGQICDLNNKINNVSDQLGRSLNEKSDMEKTVQNLNELKDNQGLQISQLFDDNKKLSRICQDQDASLKLGEQERMKMEHELNDKNCHIKDLDNQIHSHVDSINATQAELDKNTTLNCNLKNKIQDLDHQCCNLKNENDSLRMNLCKEQDCRQNLEHKNADLSNMLADRERILANLNVDYENEKAAHGAVCDENGRFELENDKLRSHVKVLTDQNQKLIDELVNVLNQDEQMKVSLARKDQIACLLRNNENTINQSVNALQDYINRTTSPCRCYPCP